MAKITKIMFPARVALSQGSGKRAILNPAVHLQFFASYQLLKSGNDFINNPETAFISALPGGYRNNNGTFNNIGNNGNLWSSTEFSATDAWLRDLDYYSLNIYKYSSGKENGSSVRCVKDKHSL
jgi:uncharacterized protein (TIGR02145 family)